MSISGGYQSGAAQTGASTLNVTIGSRASCAGGAAVAAAAQIASEAKAVASPSEVRPRRVHHRDAKRAGDFKRHARAIGPALRVTYRREPSGRERRDRHLRPVVAGKLQERDRGPAAARRHQLNQLDVVGVLSDEAVTRALMHRHVVGFVERVAGVAPGRRR